MKDIDIVRQNWDRYTTIRDSGHTDFVEEARLNNRMYAGGGRQWSDDDRQYLENLNRPVIENNGIFPAVNTAIGMQIKTRADISFKPRNADTDSATATDLAKVIMQIMDDIKYRWKETEAFADALIEKRGFFDIRVEFDENMQGNIVINVIDPADVLIDNNASGYDPETWNDVIIRRWLHLDDIEDMYGKAARKKVENASPNTGDDGDEDHDYRETFGDPTQLDDNQEDWSDKEKTKYFLVIDRQRYRMVMTEVYVTIDGDIYTADDLTQDQIKELVANGAVKTKTMRRRIEWIVTTSQTLLHKDWSPYSTFTIIPVFAYFRRGLPIGMVDNARGPQEFLNKNLSAFQHIVAGIANTGWKVQRGSLTNMQTEDLADEGSRSGLVIEYSDEEGTVPPERIAPPQMPHGMDRMIDRAEFAIKTVTGMSDAMQGLNGREISGKAIETKQYQGQTQLALPLDNLTRSRYMVAIKIYELVQRFYIEHRVFMITDTESGRDRTIPIEINAPQPDGSILNDVTTAEYDVVVTNQPTTDTFRDNQFQQVMEMREKGVAVPDDVVISLSSLEKKNEIIEKIGATSTPPPDPVAEARAAEILANKDLKEAQAERVRGQAVNDAIDALYSALQAAGVIAATPSTAPLADTLVRSAGYVDKDASPLIPSGGDGTQAGGSGGAGSPPGQVPPGSFPPNTNPTTPVPPEEGGPPGGQPPAGAQPESPEIGVNRGIETQRIEK